MLLGFVAAILLTISNVGRGYRALAAIGWFIGISTLIAAWKGMCVVSNLLLGTNKKKKKKRIFLTLILGSPWHASSAPSTMGAVWGRSWHYWFHRL
jgi:hypothetical protein